VLNVRFAVVIGLVIGGCFYIDPVQTRSAVKLSPYPGDVHVVRDGRLLVMAQLDRPDQFRWQAWACADKNGVERPTLFYDVSGTASSADLHVSAHVDQGDDTSPLTRSIVVEVSAHDDRGAAANGPGSISRVVYLVDDAPPTLELHMDAHSLTVGAPIDLFARYGDPDDGTEDISLSWEFAAPSATPPFMLGDTILTATDPTHVTAHRRLVPMVSGDWDVKVTAKDRLDTPTERHLSFTVLPDRPPCLAQSRPMVPPPGTTLPVTEPELFQVAVVTDDLDSYPRLSTDPLFGTATFAWSILPPGASVRQLLVGTTGNTFDFDPGAFTPGDIVELRVEIFDRNHTQVPCADDLATCALEAGDCIQRQTWRLETR
jgi:hypothetical protein